MRTLLAALAAALIVAGLATAGNPKTVVELASSGPIKATLTYVQVDELHYRNQRLTITRASRKALDVRLTPAHSRLPAPPLHALAVRDLDGGEPEVTVSVWTGGANCCYALYVFRYDRGRYRGSYFNAGQAGLTVVNLDEDAQPELRSGDQRFKYLFSSGVESYAPVRIYRFRAGRLVAVTREFPSLVRQSEREAWQAARTIWRMDGNSHGALAAWSATKYLLGEGAEVWPRLAQLIEAGTIEAKLEYDRRPFLTALRGALRDFGYLALPQRS